MRILAPTVVSLVFAFAPTHGHAGACDDLTKMICPAGADAAGCGGFLDGKLKDASGQPLKGLPRLQACKLVLDDQSTLTQFKDELKVKHDTRWYTFDVEAPSRKQNGKAWDVLGGAPDLSACFAIGDRSIGCAPNGSSVASISSSKCKDAFKCWFKVKTVPSAVIVVDLVDVDASENDYVGRCAFSPSHPQIECRNGITLKLRD